MDRAIPHPAAAHSCRLCGQSSAENPTICSSCERTYGPRVALLLARAETDHDFATACLANFPAPLRERFAALLGKRCLLPGADSQRGPGLRSVKPRKLDARLLKTAN
jgi:hypothetical protein